MLHNKQQQLQRYPRHQHHTRHCSSPAVACEQCCCTHCSSRCCLLAMLLHSLPAEAVLATAQAATAAVTADAVCGTRTPDLSQQGGLQPCCSHLLSRGEHLLLRPRDTIEWVAHHITPRWPIPTGDNAHTADAVWRTRTPDLNQQNPQQPKHAAHLSRGCHLHNGPQRYRLSG